MKPDPSVTDLTDEQWATIEPLIPPPGVGGRKREANMRQIVNAIRYLQATGCGWRGLPDSFPNRSTVRHYYDLWRFAGIWKQIEEILANPKPKPEEPTETGYEDLSKRSEGTC